MMGRMSRRRVMGLLFGGVVGQLVISGEDAAAQHTPLDTYFWEKVDGPFCSADGFLYETWCYMECAGGTCQALWCEKRQVGTC